jgi:uncharacterized DUF497 family protein
VEFEWDEQKRQSNIEKHGIDFVQGKQIWEGPTLEIPARERAGEHRIKAIGKLLSKADREGEVCVICTVIYTWREGTRRIISARLANRKERADYEDATG